MAHLGYSPAVMAPGPANLAIASVVEETSLDSIVRSFAAMEAEGGT
jgi:hypothetical protein